MGVPCKNMGFHYNIATTQHNLIIYYIVPNVAIQ